MFTIPILPNKSEPIRKNASGSRFEEMFNRSTELKLHPEIAMFGGLSISNNSPDQLNIGYGSNTDTEKTDILQAGGTLEITTAPNKIFLSSDAGPGLTSNFTLYYDYYTHEILEAVRIMSVNVQADAIREVLPELQQIVNNELHITMEQKSDSILNKIIKAFRKTTGGR